MNRKCEDYIYVKWENRSTMYRIILNMYIYLGTSWFHDFLSLSYLPKHLLLLLYVCLVRHFITLHQVPLAMIYVEYLLIWLMFEYYSESFLCKCRAMFRNSTPIIIYHDWSAKVVPFISRWCFSYKQPVCYPTIWFEQSSCSLHKI